MKITIKNVKGIGVLTRAADGKWEIELNGKKSGPLYYSQEQVDRIVAKAKADGSEIITEN